jgi:hypothetical protein
METKNENFGTIDEYIASTSPEIQEKLNAFD